jgi:hypothetical protein
VEQDVFERLVAGTCRADGDAETLDQLLLTDVLSDISGAERPVDLLFLRRSRG